MLLIDGVSYEEWTPPIEEELEDIVIEHSEHIFGSDSIYLDQKIKLKTISGVGSIPDGFAIIFNNQPEWHIVEVELSSHDIYSHVVNQVTRFMDGIENLNTQDKLFDAMWNAIDNDHILKHKLQIASGNTNPHLFLSTIIKKTLPTLTLIIEKEQQSLDNTLNKFSYLPHRIIEFKTFRGANANSLHAHLFKPLFTPNLRPAIPISGDIWVRVTGSEYHRFAIPPEYRVLFPGFHDDFILIADDEEIITCVAYANKNIPHGDKKAGTYFSWNLKKWFEKHPAIKEGDNLKVSVIEPMKKYRLEIVK
jgi:hypothetical protein